MNIYNCLSAEYRKWKYILYSRLKPWAMFFNGVKIFTELLMEICFTYSLSLRFSSEWK